MRQQQVMRDLQRRFEIAFAGRVQAPVVAQNRRHPRLVVRDPVVYAIAQPAHDNVGVFHKGFNCIAVDPAALVLQRLREIPVIQRHKRRDIGFQQPIHQAIVEIKAALVGLAATFG
jgi:hypothetical protein